MAYRVTLMPSQRIFDVDEGETILSAALRQSLGLPYGCRDGACGACKGRILSGRVDYGRAQLQALPEHERAQSLALFCCAMPASDLVVECREIGKLGDIPVKTLPARVHRMERVAEDVMLLVLKLPATDRLLFVAGQYVDILLKDGRRRSFSIANAPHDDEFLQLHVRRVVGGVFTEHVFAGLKERDILRIRGPLGSFHLPETSQRPAVLVAGGTGFAPIKAIVEHAIATGSTRPMSVYWGARDPAGLYMDALARNWAQTHEHIRYVPVISEAVSAHSWTGRTGLVHHAVMDDFADLSTYQAYVCGAPAMVDAARADLVGTCKLPAEEFHSDAFSFSTDPVAA